MTTKEDVILYNQVEIMNAISLLLRYARPELAGRGGELDMIREDLLRRHHATMSALSLRQGQPR